MNIDRHGMRPILNRLVPSSPAPLLLITDSLYVLTLIPRRCVVPSSHRLPFGQLWCRKISCCYQGTVEEWVVNVENMSNKKSTSISEYICSNVQETVAIFCHIFIHGPFSGPSLLASKVTGNFRVRDEMIPPLSAGYRIIIT
jgi:hypothetical protein